MTVFDNKRQTLLRALLGGLLGMAGCLLLGWLSQPGSFFGGRLTFDFTFCYNSNVPEALGAVLRFLLWFLFGAEIGVATLPFADGGRALLLRSLCHFGVMALTLWGWVMLNFPYEPWPGLILTFLLPFALVYALIWLGRWVGWYAEVAQIRERLGLSPSPSLLKWRETLPHIGFSLLLCGILPFLLRVFDAPDAPVLVGIFLPFLLLPVGGFMSGLSLGRRQGICPLYPPACGLFYLPAVFLLMNSSAPFHCAIVFCAALAGNLLGAGMRRLQSRREGQGHV